MKKIILLLSIVAAVLSACSDEKYTKNSDGISLAIKTDSGSYLLKLSVITNDIIHIEANPSGAISELPSLVAIKVSDPTVIWTVTEKDTKIILATTKVSVEVDPNTGNLRFSDMLGNTKLVESINGKKFTPIELEGKSYFTIRQKFESPNDEAFYGLGQHQHHLMNYKGKDVDLTQQNIVSVNPFLVSNKNYGLLWDNYSITKFGDPRSFQEISSLKLFDEKGVEGGLTARYTNVKDASQIYLERSEKNINFQYLENLKDIPKEFPMAEGKVTWGGFIESAITGMHKFQVYTSGYIKIWINDELVIDNWRQGWNAWWQPLGIQLEAGKKIAVRIEWIPDSGQSFMSLKWLSPVDEKEQNNLSLWSEVADQIDYYFVNGQNIDEVISGYRTVTGKSPIMPKWAMGLWQSRERYKTQDELLGVVKEFRQKQIPLDNIVLDWFYWPESKWGDHNFDSNRFPDPVSMINELHQINAHIMISVWPKFYVGTENYQYMDAKGWLFKYNVQNQQRDWVGPGYVSTFYDVYNPEARKYFWDQMNEKLFSKGIDAWWLDASEPDILSNSSISERKKLSGPTYLGPAAKYFNPFSLLNCEAVYNGQRSADSNKRVFILTRSAFAGQQRYAAATWSGDVVSRWHDLHAQISAGLNFSISGIPFWTTDIGGFSLERRYENPTPADLDEWRELNTRWYQFGAFCPLFRVHGQFPLREIFNVSPVGHPAYQSMLYYDQLRYTLMPYIYTLAGMTYHNDYTIMRALVMDFPTDSKVLNIADQFMFGPAFMVCPVTEYKAKSREVYLPSGTGWFDFYSGKFYEGGQTIIADAPYQRIPLFVKAGSIIPMGPAIQYSDEDTTGNLKLLVFGEANGSFTLYSDQGTNYDYEKGSFSTLQFDYDSTNKSLKIGTKQGGYSGEPNERKIEILYFDKNSKIGYTPVAKANKNVDYTNTEVVVELLK